MQSNYSTLPKQKFQQGNFTFDQAPYRTSSQSGLTLIEILIVITLIGLLLSWLGGSLFTTLDQAKVGITEGKMKQALGNISLYQLKFNRMPPDLKTANVSDDAAADAWGAPLQYRVADGGRSVELKSFGADGKAGGSGADADIVQTGP